MNFHITEQEEIFRKEVSKFFQDEFPPDFIRELENEPAEERRLFDECVRRLSQNGWLGIGWPREYGGQERSHTEQLIYYIEMYLRIPQKVSGTNGAKTRH